DAAEKEFHAFRGKLALPKGVNLRHAQSFEKDSVTLEVEFPSRQELEQRWMYLREILVGDKQR
ncbi:MAG: hypothetical protein OEL66_10175, partial [Desulfobulbaceae bacterium]|nr:hypothetical protein [Desulfobulbaceae bacterium]